MLPTARKWGGEGTSARTSPHAGKASSLQTDLSDHAEPPRAKGDDFARAKGAQQEGRPGMKVTERPIGGTVGKQTPGKYVVHRVRATGCP